jgi:hypothetical protein
MLKLADLKHRVYQCWENLSSFNGALVQPEQFKADVRKQFGDLRRKQTWINAYCQYTARNSLDVCLDAWTLIRYDFNFTPERWDYELRHQILDAFLAIPEGAELLKTGLEQLFEDTLFTPEERSEANGFIRLVAEQQARNGLPTLPVRGVFGAYAA